jgi:uncharacterized protein YbjT (DUF2867 family)
MNNLRATVLLTGVTGFVGGRLVQTLIANGIRPRCLIRSVERFNRQFALHGKVEIVEADLLDRASLAKVLQGIDVAYYLIHSMGRHTFKENKLFAERDRMAAQNFIRAADQAGIQRVIYLGGLGEVGTDLSKHLASRQQVSRILQSGKVSATVLRAANIIGAGGAPFEMLRHLVERLPVLVCPRWVNTRCQPIDINDAVAYLFGCLINPDTAGLELDIGGPDIITYREMMRIYAHVRGLKRLIITVPVLTPYLSSMWVSLITPVPSGVAIPLLEGLRNEVICRDNRIRDLVPLSLTPMDVSICNALQEVEKGPGKLVSKQACFFRPGS